MRRDFDKQVEQITWQMESEVGAIRNDYEAQIEELKAELRQEREKRARTHHTSVEYQTRLEQQEKVNMSMTNEVEDLQSRVKKLEEQLAAQAAAGHSQMRHLEEGKKTATSALGPEPASLAAVDSYKPETFVDEALRIDSESTLEKSAQKIDQEPSQVASAEAKEEQQLEGPQEQPQPADSAAT